jgi:hypothetical protein
MQLSESADSHDEQPDGGKREHPGDDQGCDPHGPEKAQAIDGSPEDEDDRQKIPLSAPTIVHANEATAFEASSRTSVLARAISARMISWTLRTMS